MKDWLRELLETGCSGKSLIVVSNREPYSHKFSRNGVVVDRPAGGVASALDDALQSLGGTWIAWGSGSADREVVDTRGRVPVPPDDSAYLLKRVWLTPGMVENYYHGYSNQVLWPLCHMTLDRVYYRNKFWRDYKRVNKIFSRAVEEEIDASSVVWIHDYHLCVLPQELRDKCQPVLIAHFWHIPWPDWGVFRICPQASEILEGLLGNDLIGFQVPLFQKNFLDCVREGLGAEVDYARGAVRYRGHQTRVEAFSISIDFKKFNAMAGSPRTVRTMNRIRRRYHLPGRVGVGIDRLEYTKALIKRLQSLQLFFERNQKWKNRFTFIQVAVPTRMREPYLSYKKAVEELVAKINRKFGTTEWQPVIYLENKIDHSDLVAYYRLADLGIISSVYDGMNLVAKEYAAAQVDEKGVLILSELTGAAEELDGAILVNPYDLEDFAEQIKNALELPEKERQGRMRSIRRQIEENDIHRWISDNLREMFQESTSRPSLSREAFGCWHQIEKEIRGRPLFLFLDYDGTLTPIVSSPDEAHLSEDVRARLNRLKNIASLAVISGRSLGDIRKKVGIEGILYVGNHGAEIASGPGTTGLPEWHYDRPMLNELLARVREATIYLPGIFIEDKTVTASIHFRQVPVPYLGRLFNFISRLSKEYDHYFALRPGKKVFEIRPLQAPDKGVAVSLILEHMGRGRFPVYIGDDVTDEDAFAALKNNGISISVGGSLNADYYLPSQTQIGQLLDRLERAIGAGGFSPPK